MRYTNARERSHSIAYRPHLCRMTYGHGDRAVRSIALKVIGLPLVLFVEHRSIKSLFLFLHICMSALCQACVCCQSTDACLPLCQVCVVFITMVTRSGLHDNPVPFMTSGILHEMRVRRGRHGLGLRICHHPPRALSMSKMLIRPLTCNSLRCAHIKCGKLWRDFFPRSFGCGAGGDYAKDVVTLLARS